MGAEISGELEEIFGAVERPEQLYRDSVFAPSSLAATCGAFERLDWSCISRDQLVGLGDALHELNDGAFLYIAPRLLSLVDKYSDVVETELVDTFYILPQLSGGGELFEKFSNKQKHAFWKVYERHLDNLETDVFPSVHIDKQQAYQNIFGD